MRTRTLGGDAERYKREELWGRVYEIQTARQADRQAAGRPEGGEAHTPREKKGPQGRRETDAATGCKAKRGGPTG